MGFSETDSSRCRNHPNNRQSPGVCSFCLREQLTKLNTSPSSFNRKKTTFISNSSSFSSSPKYSSSSATAAAAASKTTGRQHRRNGSEAYVSVGMVLNNGLKKSRSVSCANLSSRGKLGTNNNTNNDVISEKIKVRVNGGEMDEGINGNLKKKNNGFLKKLINNTSKKTKGVLMHSKTMKERSPSSLNPGVTIKN